MADDKERADLPPGIALAWGLTSATRRRGPKPAHSVERIVEVAIEVSDEEGFAGLSMPKIAARLGITANALYRYVRSKEELLVLLAEAGWGPPPESVRQATTWRAAATGWTRAMIDRFRIHPWLLDLPVQTAPMTPHLVDWLEVFMEGMTDSGLNDQDTLGCAVLLDGYARSIARLAHTFGNSEGSAAMAAAIGFLRPLLRERGFPRAAALMADTSYVEDELPPSDVEFGLERILAGIEALIAERSDALSG
ncbi:DNA-binding transcriptional regulator, AcrR family [Nonomuraea solani]|uniref:DNA-binding transcriptional regulator, AcrR family n=1 Tax=Nonomuraea solani TaxID=1144553 RepID=A0A1H6EGS0_9ACTN|nr:TetR/AcrR family transcriptional regulator [Nonomuraea solani]SEG96159.1 DNA-binding transcriptional regulator, AcrR family [Nonomuraea solani]